MIAPMISYYFIVVELPKKYVGLTIMWAGQAWTSTGQYIRLINMEFGQHLTHDNKNGPQFVFYVQFAWLIVWLATQLKSSKYEIYI